MLFKAPKNVELPEDAGGEDGTGEIYLPVSSGASGPP
jgi:hypothetical protein